MVAIHSVLDIVVEAQAIAEEAQVIVEVQAIVAVVTVVALVIVKITTPVLMTLLSQSDA